MRREWMICTCLLLGLSGATHARCEPTLPSGEEIAGRINARAEGSSALSELSMELLSADGTQRARTLRALRRDREAERQTLFVFDSPQSIRGTGLLVYDYAQTAQEDRQWLYLPALRKVRRIATGSRGDSFVGTEFSFDDMKNGSRVGIADYRWSTLRRDSLGDRPCFVVRGQAVSDEVARELGYGSIVLWVDAELWLARRIEVSDPAGRALKTIEIADIRQIDGIWTAHSLRALNHQSGNQTSLTLDRVEYEVPVSDDLFTERALERGRTSAR